MQFLKTLFWMVLAVSVAIFATRNWRDVTVDLWGPLQADIKLPILMGLMLLLGWLPTWLIMRGKLWRLKRRLAPEEQVTAIPAAPPAPPAEDAS